MNKKESKELWEMIRDCCSDLILAKDEAPSGTVITEEEDCLFRLLPKIQKQEKYIKAVHNAKTARRKRKAQKTIRYRRTKYPMIGRAAELMEIGPHHLREILEGNRKDVKDYTKRYRAILAESRKAEEKAAAA